MTSENWGCFFFLANTEKAKKPFLLTRSWSKETLWTLLWGSLSIICFFFSVDFYSFLKFLLTFSKCNVLSSNLRDRKMQPGMRKSLPGKHQGLRSDKCKTE